MTIETGSSWYAVLSAVITAGQPVHTITPRAAQAASEHLMGC